jgi:hypothetical protein
MGNHTPFLFLDTVTMAKAMNPFKGIKGVGKG